MSAGTSRAVAERSPRSRRFVPLAALGCALLAAQPAALRPEVYTGRELLAACRDAPGSDARQTCAGWADWVTMSPHFCPPGVLDPGEVVAALVAWLETHPEKLHMPGGALVQEAFYERYPCPRS